MKTRVNLIILISLLASQAWSETADSLPDEAMLEFLASFDEKDSAFIDEVMEEGAQARIQTQNDSVNGESHE